MDFDRRKGALLVNVGTRGICVFTWEGIRGSEIEDALEVIRKFLASKGPNPFTINGQITEEKVTVQVIDSRMTFKGD
jgi:hypothetical protein